MNSQWGARCVDSKGLFGEDDHGFKEAPVNRFSCAIR